MLCQNCNNNEANVRYTQIINGEKKEIMLCDKCSQKLGINNFNMPIDFSSFFEGIFNDYDDTDFIPVLDRKKEIKCDNCNMTYEEFASTGKFGCANCYNAFSNKIDSILKRIHGSNENLGRKSNFKTKELEIKTIKNEEKKEDKLEQLQNKLKQAVKEEKYEQAAKIRDEIKRYKEE